MSTPPPHKPLEAELEYLWRVHELLAERLEAEPSNEQLPPLIRKTGELLEALSRLEDWWRQLEILDDSDVPIEQRHRRYGPKPWWPEAGGDTETP